MAMQLQSKQASQNKLKAISAHRVFTTPYQPSSTKTDSSSRIINILKSNTHQETDAFGLLLPPHKNKSKSTFISSLKKKYGVYTVNPFGNRRNQSVHNSRTPQKIMPDSLIPETQPQNPNLEGPNPSSRLGMRQPKTSRAIYSSRPSQSLPKQEELHRAPNIAVVTVNQTSNNKDESPPAAVQPLVLPKKNRSQSNSALFPNITERSASQQHHQNKQIEIMSAQEDSKPKLLRKRVKQKKMKTNWAEIENSLVKDLSEGFLNKVSKIVKGYY